MLKYMSLVVALLIGCDVIVEIIGLPVPGAAVAMLLLSLLCSVQSETGSGVARLFDGFIPLAPMLFVPAAVGFVTMAEEIAVNWIPIILAITLSTAAALVVTGLSFQALLRLRRRHAPG